MADRVEWLRLAMAGSWAALGPRYTEFRDGVAAALAALPHDTVVTSHFIAINAAIGVATVLHGALPLVEGGHEADTLIR